MMKRLVYIGISIALVILIQQIYNSLYTPKIPNAQLARAKVLYKKEKCDVCIFVDFSEHSGRNRFIVYDLNKDKVLLKGLCGIGNGHGSTSNHPIFSNEIGSNCSSLGIYKLRECRMSNGYSAIALNGLSASNSNAAKRLIYIHSSKIVSASGFGYYPFKLPMGSSKGCFTISTSNYKKLKQIINNQKNQSKPIYLIAYIYNN